MILITGHPRSGTSYTAALLRLAGLDVGHETIRKDGTVSWLHIAQNGGSVSWLPKDIEGVSWETKEKEVLAEKWDTLIHLVRNPLRVISSAQTLSNEAFDYMFATLNKKPEGDMRCLRWYMWAWLNWNEYIETKISKRFRTEDLCKDNPEKLNEFLKLTGGSMPKEMPPKNTNSRAHKMYTWLDLELEDKELCDKIKIKAKEYGYSVFTFGAVIMAKNEAHNLHRCLASIRPIVDEIIFVDTGSTDKSMEIAREYGAKIFEHPWEDNFSKHRNQCLSYSTCDWVIQIDCDEELCGGAELLKPIVKAVNKSEFNAMAILLRDMQGGVQAMQFNAPRLFRRGAVHFEDIVHNRPVFKGAAAMISGETTVWLQHYGYDIEADKKLAKLNRTKSLLEKRIRENEKDYEAYFYLTQVEGELKNNQEVLDLCEKYVSFRGECGEKFNESVYYTHLQAIYVINQKYTDRYVKCLNEYMNLMPNDLDITFAVVEYAAAVNDTKLLRDSAERFVSNYIGYSRDSHKQATRFTYTFKPECLCTAFFYVTTLSFSAAVQNLDLFNKALPGTNETFKAKAAKDMQLACKNLGVDWRYSEDLKTKGNRQGQNGKSKKKKGKGRK